MKHEMKQNRNSILKHFCVELDWKNDSYTSTICSNTTISLSLTSLICICGQTMLAIAYMLTSLIIITIQLIDIMAQSISNHIHFDSRKFKYDFNKLKCNIVNCFKPILSILRQNNQQLYVTLFFSILLKKRTHLYPVAILTISTFSSYMGLSRDMVKFTPNLILTKIGSKNQPSDNRRLRSDDI